MNDNELTDAEWAEMTEGERRQYREDQTQDYLDECSSEQRARFFWEQGQ